MVDRHAIPLIGYLFKMFCFVDVVHSATAAAVPVSFPQIDDVIFAEGWTDGLNSIGSCFKIRRPLLTGTNAVMRLVQWRFDMFNLLASWNVGSFHSKRLRR